MKNFILMAFTGLVLVALSGCEKDQLSPDVHNHDVEGTVIYTITHVNGQLEAEPIVLEKASSAVPERAVNTRNPNSSATGIYNFPPSEDFFLTFNFTAMENPGGVHGSTHITGSESSGLLDVTVASECILVNDNIAYFGGTITDWNVAQELQDFFDNVIGGPYVGYGVGHQFYWSVQDNGEGGNSTGPDGGGDAYIVIPEGEDAEENGFESWCQYTELDYAGTFHPPFTHGHVPGATPSNVQVQ